MDEIPWKAVWIVGGIALAVVIVGLITNAATGFITDGLSNLGG